MSSTPGWAKEWHPITYTQTFACLPGSPYFPVLARLAFLVNRTGAAVCKALSPQLSAEERTQQDNHCATVEHPVAFGCETAPTRAREQVSPSCPFYFGKIRKPLGLLRSLTQVDQPGCEPWR